MVFVCFVICGFVRGCAARRCDALLAAVHGFLGCVVQPSLTSSCFCFGAGRFLLLLLVRFCSDTVSVLPIFICPCIRLVCLVPLCCTEDGGYSLFFVAVDDRLCRCKQDVAVESRDTMY